MNKVYATWKKPRRFDRNLIAIGGGSAGLVTAYIAVDNGQRSVSHPQVFAAGDVAIRVAAPRAKSGVHAVRAGPLLAGNLCRALEGLPPALDRARRTNNLYLLATGPRQAVVSWGGWSATDRWAWRWKNWIGRRFMKQYVLAKGGTA
ncbi:hypothetical protein GALL_238200 [mine drainage metagenome]|uniref:Uncharacterized protein n=1 Tax=mine drainage metagenome TaxID=410659 RepID=A0A1J5RQE8_9ZZZZ